MNRIKLVGIAGLFALLGCSSSTEPGPSGSGGNLSGSGGKIGGSGGKTGSGGGGGGGDQGSGGSGTGSGGEQGGSGGSGGNPGGSGGTGMGSGGNQGSGGTGTGSGGKQGSGGTSGSGGALAQPQVVTSAPNAYWKTDGTLTTVTTNADITVNDTSTAQTWEGFGGAFNEMGWNYLSMLGQADRDKAMKLLFGTDGARFAWGRIPMGASDYAMDRYSLDETANDTSMASFSITRDQQKLIPFIKAAQAIKSDLRFWASPWTPPTWMKTSPFKSGNVVSAFDGGNMTDSDAILKAYAQYFIKFVQAYKQQGINVEIVAPQNEPNYDQNYPSCLWATALFTKFVGQYLGPAFDTAGLGTKIMLGTMSNADSGKDPSIVSGVMGNATAKAYIKLIGMQWGMQAQVSNAKSYSLPIWQTEHKCGNYPWASGYKATAPNDQAYAVESWGLIRDWIKAGVTSYSAWNMVLDTVGKGIDTTRDWAQNALLTVNTSAKTLTVTPTYYVFRHLSQFVVPGAKVVGTSSNDALAFKNPDGSIVAVIYNSGGAKTMTVAMGGKKLQFAMPGTGWATVLSQ